MRLVNLSKMKSTMLCFVVVLVLQVKSSASQVTNSTTPTTPGNGAKTTASATTPGNGAKITASPTTPGNGAKITTSPTTPGNGAKITTSPTTPGNGAKITASPTTPGNGAKITTSPTTPGNGAKITASPTTPGNGAKITASPTTPGNGAKITASPTTPGNGAKITASPTTPGNGAKITTSPTTPGNGAKITASPTTPGNGAKITASPTTPGNGAKITTSLTTPGNGAKITASPTTPGNGAKITASPTTPGNGAKITTSPTTPGNGAKITTSPTTLGNGAKITASPTTPGNGAKITASPTTPGNGAKITASPTTPGNSTKITASPTTRVNGTKTTASPTTPGNGTKITASRTTRVNGTKTTASPTTPGNGTKITASPTAPGNATKTTASPTTPGNGTNTNITTSPTTRVNGTNNIAFSTTRVTSTVFPTTQIGGTDTNFTTAPTSGIMFTSSSSLPVTAIFSPTSSINGAVSSTAPVNTTPYPTTRININPSTTSRVIATMTSTPTPPISYYEYEISSFEVTEIRENTQDDTGEQDFKILSTLINECSEELTSKENIYYRTFEKFLKDQICGIEEFKDKECGLTLTKLKCGSLIADYNLVLGVKGADPKAGDVVKNEAKDGKLGGLVVDDKSFSVTPKGKTEPPKPTSQPQPTRPSVYVIVTMKYTWEEFCHVEELFREKIAARSYDLQANKLKPSDIYIVNNQCENPDSSKTGIDVWIVAPLGKDQDKVTIQIGEDLKYLLDSRQLRKLGNHFENRITDVKFGGKKAPQSSGMSDTEKIWLAVGICLAILLALLVIYLCCTRKSRQTKSDTERGPNYFAMDNIDGSKKEPTVLVNQGFDEQEAHTPLVQRMSTFKEQNEKPLEKSENDELKNEPDDGNKQGPSDKGDEKKAPLGEGEDTDDELGMTVADVAIEPEKRDKNAAATPRGTLPIIPPDPVHMAIQDVAKFNDDTGGQHKRDKEYEDLDQTKTDPKTYPSNTAEKNRTANVVPAPETVVKLTGENSYINANFVKDHHGVASFIATQHPLSNTMRDFWSLVWQHDVSVIVMVNDSEKDMENFHSYWMNHKNSLTIYGNMQVKTEAMESIGAFNVTTFILKNSQEADVTKVVRHFRFTNWPDKGFPEVKEFAQFIQSVEKARLDNLKSPTVVHCKDGQGYAGVAIAAGIGLRVYNESDKKSMVDVFDCVNKMRADRNGIVSSKDLYKYIFKVLKTITDNASTSDSKL